MSMTMRHAFSASAPPAGPSPPPMPRSVAAGRRLAPLPPSLRTGAGGHRQVSSAQSTPPSSTPPPLGTVSGGGGGGSGGARSSSSSSSKPRHDIQRRLAPVTELSRPVRPSASSTSRERRDGSGAASGSTRRPFAETAPTHRASRSGSAVADDELTAATAATVHRHRAAATTTTRGTPQRRRVSATTDTASSSAGEQRTAAPPMPLVGAGTTSTSALARPRPRAPALLRRVGGGGVADTTAAAATRAPTMPPERRSQQQGRASVGTAVGGDGSGGRAAEFAGAVDGVRASSSSSFGAAHAPPPRPRVELPYAPDDMDERWLADPANWCTEAELPPLVWSLLEGSELEPPYTSRLWTHAYANPADVQAPASDYTSGLPPAYEHRATAAQQQHARDGGFYACVRCSTPICAPTHQVLPSSLALRGLAVFDALHMDGVELSVSTSATVSAADSVGAARERRSSLARARATLARAGLGGDAVLDRGAGGLRFVVRCRHCGGCLGAVRLGEAAARAASADASRHKSTAATATTTTTTETAERALFCANSVCLVHMPYRTRATLDQAILDAADPSSDTRGGSSSATTTTTAAAAAAAAPVPVRQTLRSLFAPPSRAAAWGVDGQATSSDDGSNSAASFDVLLGALNPFDSAAASRTSTGSDDDAASDA